MTVSAGFYKKIQQWVIDEQSGDVTFRPFQTDGNPYRANVFLVSTNPEPLAEIYANDLKLHADSLVDTKLFEELNQEQLNLSSREYKGNLNFLSWMKEHFQEEVVLTYVNCYQAANPEKLKQMKRQKEPLYLRGFEIFEEILNEFSPEILILNGSSAFKLFMEVYTGVLVERSSSLDTVQELEKQGVFAKLPLKNGEHVKVVACRNMMYFGKDGNSFGDLKQTLANELFENSYLDLVK